MPPTRSVQLLAAAGLLGLGLAACGDDDATTADTSSTTAGTSPTAEESQTNTEPGTIEIELVDYDFVGLPDSVPAGTTFTVTNSAETEIHEVVALRLPDDEDRSVADLQQLPPDEAQAALMGGGPPAFVLLAAPGGPQIDALGDGTLSQPGRYALVCMIPTGADPDEFLAAAAESDGPPDVPGGPPHIVHGMFSELIVE